MRNKIHDPYNQPEEITLYEGELVVAKVMGAEDREAALAKTIKLW